MRCADNLFPIAVECLEEGGYHAECPVLQGCHVEGLTYAEAIENLEDAIKAFLDSYRELGKKLPSVPRIARHTAVPGGIPMRGREVLSAPVTSPPAIPSRPSPTPARPLSPRRPPDTRRPS